ncbi:biotin/lipoyl-binding protein [Fusobacterium polymorphum]|uniref:biotin/lipoyl-binding protein n=1 Tax=Fusobacterium nucleatum subsp. polymorphum TaxID=76857 RepID=UPI0021C491C7|nr:biotin/lipoyl-binding protein [Fusobacterium polymorphum]
MKYKMRRKDVKKIFKMDNTCDSINPRSSLLLFFKKKNDGVKYLTEVVKRSDISQTIVASGTVRSNNRVEVGAQVSGKITKINVILGQKVKKGDLLATIDSLT